MRTTKSIKKVYLSSTGEEIDFSTIKTGEEVDCKIFSLSYYPGRGYSLWIIPNAKIEKSDNFTMEKFGIMDGEVKKILPCERASKARETEAIEKLNEIIKDEKLSINQSLQFTLKGIEIKPKFNTERDGKIFSPIGKGVFVTEGMKNIISWGNTQVDEEDEKKEIQIFTTYCLNKLKDEKNLDYLQSDCNRYGNKFWIIDDGNVITFLLPSEY